MKKDRENDGRSHHIRAAHISGWYVVAAAFIGLVGGLVALFWNHWSSSDNPTAVEDNPRLKPSQTEEGGPNPDLKAGRQAGQLDSPILRIDESERRPTTGQEARQRFRSLTGTEAIRVEESGLPLEVVPSRTFGFIDPISFTSWKQGFGKVSVRRKYRADYFEVYKVSSGSVYILGFVGSETALSLRRGDRALNLAMYSEMWSSAPEAVAFLISWISTANYRMIERESAEEPIGVLDVTVESPT